MANLTIHISTEHPDATTIAAERARSIVEDLDADGAHSFDVELVDADDSPEGTTLSQWTRTAEEISATEG